MELDQGRIEDIGNGIAAMALLGSGSRIPKKGQQPVRIASLKLSTFTFFFNLKWKQRGWQSFL